MFQQMPFIGRQKELEKIENAIKESGTRRVLCIHGPGGIGKTRLLAEIHRLYTSNGQTPLLVADILDFDDRTLHLAENIESQIARELDEQAFEPFLRRLVDLRISAGAGVSPQTLKEDSERTHQTFLDDINKLSLNKRLVLLLDTTEKLESEEVWNRIINLIVESNNSLFLLAGRNAEQLWTALQFQLGDDVQLIELKDFKDEFAQEYLNQKQSVLHINLNPQLEPKLLWLAGGRPILLDLAVEWLSRDMPRDWMTEKTLEELESLSQEEMTQYKEDFEIQLVRNITQIRDRMDRLTLVMSRVYPLTPAMIAKLLRIREDEAKTLFENAQTYVFVKPLPDGRISLHDEMRRMVNEYVWPEVDPQELRQRRDSRIAAQLFLQEEDQLNKRVRERRQSDLGGLFEREALFTRREVINKQSVEHALYSDINWGFKVWKKTVDQRRTENDFRIAKSLVDLAQPYYKEFAPDQKFEFDMLEARVSNDTGLVREAEKMLNELVAKNQDRQDRKANIYNALALVEEKLGKLREARDHQLECLAIVRKINPQFVPAVANRAGYIHRLLGEWQEAEKYYQLALTTTPKRNLRLIASLLNNLGYVYGSQTRYSQLNFHCNQAIEIWSRVGAEREVGWAETTIAIFSRVRGQYDDAIKLLQRAINRYELPDDHEKLTSAYFELGWTQWYKAEEVDEKAADIGLLDWDQDLLDQGRRSLEESRRLAERYGLETYLPGILHLTALVDWYLGQITKDNSLLKTARELNTVSYEKSRQVGDIRYAISSLLADAEWDYEIGEYSKMDDYAQQLQEYERGGYYYPLYFGRMRRIKADIAFSKGQFESAFSNYAEGLPLIHEHGGFGRYKIDRELLRLASKMEQYLTIAEIEQWANYLRERWSEIEKQDIHLLTTWADQQILRATLRSIEW